MFELKTHLQIYCSLLQRIHYIVTKTSAKNPPRDYQEYHQQLLSIDRTDLIILSVLLALIPIFLLSLIISVLNKWFIGVPIVLLLIFVKILKRTPNAVYDYYSGGLKFPVVKSFWLLLSAGLLGCAIYLCCQSVKIAALDNVKTQTILQGMCFLFLAHLEVSITLLIALCVLLTPHAKWWPVAISPYKEPTDVELYVFALKFGHQPMMVKLCPSIKRHISEYL